MRARDWVWDGGRPSLDFVNTYRNRKTGGWELLREPEDLLAWLGLQEDLPFTTPEATLSGRDLPARVAGESSTGASGTTVGEIRAHETATTESSTGGETSADSIEGGDTSAGSALGEGGSAARVPGEGTSAGTIAGGDTSGAGVAGRGASGRDASAVERAVAGMELLVEARELREAICRCLDAAMAGDQGFPEPINRWAARRQPSLVRLAPDLSLVRLPPRDPVVAALAEIACDAIELIGGPDLRQVRVCASPTCGLRFADRSNAGSRQWCSMKRCGNREKVRLHRARRGEL
ncbi:CGNR zinc finger domain-containing protein [Nonomuraea africana]|uniref:CGNR zinc finger domain-containing protein n=1 Tax=Nonomuraea africana TaxID=46171 RepID=UPI0033D86B07